MASIVIGFRHIADSIFFHAAVEALWSMRQVCRTWYCRVALEFFHLRDVVLTGEDSTSPGGQIFSFKTRTGRELDTTDTPLWRYCNIADVRPMPSAPEAQPDHPPDAPTSDDAPPPRDAIRTVRRPASAAHHDFKWLGPSRHGNRRNVFDNHFKADYAPAPTMVVVNYRDVGFGVQAVRPASVQWYQPRIFYFVVHGDVTGAPLVWESAGKSDTIWPSFHSHTNQPPGAPHCSTGRSGSMQTSDSSTSRRCLLSSLPSSCPVPCGSRSATTVSTAGSGSLRSRPISAHRVSAETPEHPASHLCAAGSFSPGTSTPAQLRPLCCSACSPVSADS